jgi:hypothetical protein|tara:strand:- start:1154 stop:1390 length:237 start_codon:yes stop_codon:yes gene_type:complete
LILQKNNLRNIFFIVLAIVVVVFFFTNEKSCGMEHMFILNDIKIYEKSLEPEFCEEILEKINSYNESCSPIIEILDCG